MTKKTVRIHNSKRAARLRLIGVIVLVLGIGGAGLVYFGSGLALPDVDR